MARLELQVGGIKAKQDGVDVKDFAVRVRETRGSARATLDIGKQVATSAGTLLGADKVIGALEELSGVTSSVVKWAEE